MNAFASLAGKTSAYMIGAVSGFAIAIPLAAVALGAGTSPRIAPAGVYGPQTPAPQAATQAHQVNRTAKGARLDLRLPQNPMGSSMMAKNVLPAGTAQTAATHVGADGAPTAQNTPDMRPARATRPPKGCVSALGPTRSSLATEDLTICVASLG
ncbi:hypothetical protein [Ancylobacter radicis]|uniref:Uncharacterized protein n=1 Tax=Ancylobacter radicis TaxID=2836179 RepID=A0ABS5R658_9HYPH|nr:hypothetical protein [Ancylobacter radicis]MBS9476720.1 hypothetical protein [Ancylobacter radicis]